MGKHSATDGQDDRDNRIPEPGRFDGGRPVPPGGAPGTGRRRRGPADDDDYFAPLRPHGLDEPPGHPEQREHAAWGAPGNWPGPRPARRDLPFDPVEDWAADWAPYDTASMLGPPAAHAALPRHGQAGRTVPRPRQEFVDAFDEPPPPRPVPHPPPGPDTPAAAVPAASGRGRARALTGVAAVTALAALAVLAGTQFHHRHHHSQDDGTPGPGAGSSAGETPSTSPARPATTGPAAGTATPASYETSSASYETSPAANQASPDSYGTASASYDALMDRRYPLDPHLGLLGAFATVPGHQAAPGTGKVVRVRVDVEKGLDLDARLFSDAVLTTLNDPRGWGHGGTMTFERVSSGHADLVVTLASPGTTAKWCATAGTNSAADNVSCAAAGTSPAGTPRTMINAYRWAQGAAAFGPARIHAYRQMLINHEVGLRLGPGSTGCPQPGAPAPVMMRQATFLSLDGGPTCAPDAWPYP